MVPTRVNLGARLRSARAKHVTNRRQSVGVVFEDVFEDDVESTHRLPIERVRMAVYGVDDFSLESVAVGETGVEPQCLRRLDDSGEIGTRERRRARFQSRRREFRHIRQKSRVHAHRPRGVHDVGEPLRCKLRRFCDGEQVRDELFGVAHVARPRRRDFSRRPRGVGDGLRAPLFRLFLRHLLCARDQRLGVRRGVFPSIPHVRRERPERDAHLLRARLRGIREPPYQGAHARVV